MCRIINKLQESELRGKHLFTSADLLATLYYIEKQGDVGRIFLSRILGVGEQVARNILKELLAQELIMTEGRSKRVSEELREFLDNMLVTEIIPSPEILGWPRTVLLQVCIDANIISSNKLVWLRDRIVRWGGAGGVILFKDIDGRISLPGGEGSDAEKSLQSILRDFKLLDCNGLVVLVGLEEKVSEWLPVYGFLEALCLLDKSF